MKSKPEGIKKKIKRLINRQKEGSLPYSKTESRDVNGSRSF